MRRRYVEIFKSNPNEVDAAKAEVEAKGQGDASYAGVVRIRGLPWR